MGKGDKKTKRGKITMGSYGKKRPHQKEKAVQEEEGEVKKKKKVKDEESSVDEKVPKKSKKG